jgi:hypothetical protein
VFRACSRMYDESPIYGCRECLINSSITSSDSFNLSSARLNKPQGLNLR